MIKLDPLRPDRRPLSVDQGHRGSRVPPVEPAWFAAGAIVSVQLGAAVAGGLFDQVSPSTVVVGRLGFASLVLLAFLRPKLASRSLNDWSVIAGLGIMMVVMNLSFYQAVDRIPLGSAVTIELLGPMGLAAVLSRRLQDFGLVLVALAGVALLAGNPTDADPIGTVYALIAALGWAGYILLTRAMARRFDGVGVLGLSMALACALALPFGWSGMKALADPDVLVKILVVAVLSAVVPFSLESLALRSLPTRAFGLMMSLSPVAATLSGRLLLEQQPSSLDILAMTIVLGANAGAILTRRHR